jgi:rubrerythrin
MIIVIILYFGIKLYVKKRTQSIENEIGEGICMECGSKVLDKKCPKCDYSQE